MSWGNRLCGVYRPLLPEKLLFGLDTIEAQAIYSLLIIYPSEVLI